MLKQIASVLIVAIVFVPLAFVVDYAARVALENRKPCECKCDCKPSPSKPTGRIGDGLTAISFDTFPVKPRNAWKVDKLDGYIVSTDRIFWTPDFYFVESHDEDPKRTGKRLMLADDDAFKRATVMQNTPVFIAAIPIIDGDDRFYLVETITEPN